MTKTRFTASTVPKEWALEVSKGNIPGTAGVLIRGHNPDIDSTTEEDLNEFGNLTYLTESETMNIASTDTSDATGGAGLLTALVAGIANDGTALTESVTMNGSTNVLTTGSFLRVNTIVGLTVGASGWNEGNVTATASTAGTVQCEMDATESISQNSAYTVPANKTFFVVKAEFNAHKLAGGQSPVVEFKGYARSSEGAAWIQLFDKTIDTGVVNELDIGVPIFTAAAAGSDIRIRGNTNEANTDVRSRLFGWLVDD